MGDIMNRMSQQDPPMTSDAKVKCACPSCHCPVPAGGGVVHEGKLYCSKTCAYDCTTTTCVCVHEGCDHEH